MQLYRVRLLPESPWLTPWQSDTLSGLLCWTCARTEGDRVLRDEIIEPGLNGEPPFIVSDAFPEDWLPIPAVVRLAPWAATDRKPIKRARWVDRSTFTQIQDGSCPQVDELIPDRGIHEYLQLRNTIGRISNTTTRGGGLYSTSERVLGTDNHKRPFHYLTIYFRARQQSLDLVKRLLTELSAWGFGADRSAGKGQFRIDSGFEKCDELDRVGGTVGSIMLSTFQPSSGDPTDGAWESFTKYGKLGPDFGLENVFKRPLIMIRPGAWFRPSVTKGWVGRAIPMREMLAPEVIAELHTRNTEVVHWAFGLAVPARFSWEAAP